MTKRTTDLARCRPATKPATVDVAWSSPPHSGRGVLSLDGVAYGFTDAGTADPAYCVGVYNLEKPDGTIYQVALMVPGRWECDCPDSTYHPERPGGCRHIAAVRRGLAIMAEPVCLGGDLEAIDPAEYDAWRATRRCCRCGELNARCACDDGTEAEAVDLGGAA